MPHSNSQSESILPPSTRRSLLAVRGQSQPLDEEGKARVEKYLRYAYLLAWNFFRRYARDMQIEDLIAETMYALTYASGRFKPEYRVPFGAYATMVIRHRLIGAVSARRQHRNHFQGHPTGSKKLEQEPEDRTLPEVGAAMEARELCELVRRMLPAEWYELLRLYHAEGRTLEDIGRDFGITGVRVGQIIVQAKERVRRYLPEWASKS